MQIFGSDIFYARCMYTISLCVSTWHNVYVDNRSIPVDGAQFIFGASTNVWIARSLYLFALMDGLQLSFKTLLRRSCSTTYVKMT